MNSNSDITLDIDIDDLFKDEEDSQTPPDTSTPSKPDMTQVMSERINTVKRNTEKETQDKIAKEFGYDTYDAMKKAQADKIATDHGFNPEDIEQVIEPMIQKRLADDPRFKELETFKERERNAYIKSQLAAINTTTGQQLKMTDLSKETLDLWAKGVELEQAYYATHGKTIIANRTTQIENGSLTHLAPGAGAGATKLRKLTDEEKDIWRSIVPGITEEELLKKTTPIGGK